ncbi:glycosyltransferase family 10 (fucosyltransferase) c-term domain-containing protein [Ditylenchus destructor]|uniref:Fucosyltransferase n=1 Tax=Ditylenchus destructor TaxID=166010 RepID=A0AAD4NJQ4_9BILA|nr:glycosyltransferase family 10 (fucosyltransferase) c-term domain-containing protein [Ditylenchus destructor]
MPIMGKLFSTVFPPLDENECPYKCVYTDDRNRFADEAAIIIFHIRNFNASDLPQFNPDRLNVFFLLESPVHSGSAYQNHQNYFNITMTYRRDSDIFLPNENAFTRIIPNKTTMDDIWREEDIRKIIGKKTKIALQVVSNCYTLSAREEYITELAKDLNITRYGDCTSQKLCPGQPCLYEKLEDHFFYIAFENSICRHYVTEKFWNLKRIIVPVVLSRMPFQGLDIPEDSYIAAEDFETPKALANYLLYLRNNLEEYMSNLYFLSSKPGTSHGSKGTAKDKGIIPFVNCFIIIANTNEHLPVRKEESYKVCFNYAPLVIHSRLPDRLLFGIAQRCSCISKHFGDFY